VFAVPLNNTGRTTSHRVVIPFFLYAAFSYVAAASMLVASANDFTGHYFKPGILAITHVVALGWATMIIFGASHQLVPVLTESRLYSETLAYLTFLLAAIGIPLLVYGFYVFNMGVPAKWGGRLVLSAIVCYLVNIGLSMSGGKKENVHATFIFTAVSWLFFTALLGLALVYNFTANVFEKDSLYYLPLHMHAGVVGWFLLLVVGVGSRLIPMFLISKYVNPGRLWLIYYLINGALLFYTLIFFVPGLAAWSLLPALGLLFAVALFINYCYQAFKARIRRQVDDQLRLSLTSVLMIALPVLLLVVLIMVMAFTGGESSRLALAYGFVIFFGWLTAIILGMTFKTLPFIIWNRVYHRRAQSGQSANPRDLFSHGIFSWMMYAYLGGFIIFPAGVLAAIPALLQSGAVLLLVSAVLYSWNVMRVVTHKPGSI
jgi:hypothetical protein